MLFVVEKHAEINPADLNLGETFTTKYVCKNVAQAGGEDPAFACTRQGDASSGAERSSLRTCCPWDRRDICLHLPQTRNLSEREAPGSSKATRSVATGWQQKLVDPALA